MLRNLAIISVSALAVSACTYSSYGPDDHRSVESAGLVSSRNVDVTGDAEFAGMIVRADGDIAGDLDVAGATVRSTADVGGNLSAAGARLRFNGTVAGDAEIQRTGRGPISFLAWRPRRLRRPARSAKQESFSPSRRSQGPITRPCD